METKFRHILIAGLTAVGLGLAGCGGGGSSSNNQPPAETGPTAAEMAATAANNAVMAANTAVAALNAMSTDAEVMAAKTLIAAAEAALMHADLSAADEATAMAALGPVKMALATVEAQIQVADLQGQIAALRTQLGLEPDDNLGDSVDALQMEVTRLQGELTKRDNLDEMEQTAVLRSRAMRRYAALSQDGGSPLTHPTLTGDATFSVTAVYGQAPKVAVTGFGGTLFTADANKANYAVEASGSLGTPSGWMGTLFRGENRNYVHWGSVATDIEAPTPTPVEDVYGVANVSLAELNANGKAIMAAEFVGTGTITHDFNARNTGTAATSPPDLVRFTGTFRGARGKFECTGTTCTSTNIDGAITLGTGWAFDPDAGAMVQVADANYMYYGYWGRVNLNPLALTGSYAFDTFAGGMGAMFDGTTTTVTAVTGTARYSGGANGIYAIDDALGGVAESGGFGADVNLTAKFGDVTGPGTISGMLSGFRTALGEKNWEVSLGMADLAEPTAGTSVNAFGTATTAPTTTWEINGREGAAGGMWSANFYGTGRNDGTPEGVAGEFTASFQGAEMIGAFGAHNMEPDRTP